MTMSGRAISVPKGLEAERKLVTVMFADIHGSLALIAGMDPEDADDILTHTVDKMRDAVHRFGGTVCRVPGDGILAIFGAPLAQEHHAERACRAALELLNTAQREAKPGVGPVRVRVGLHSGEVVVRHLATDMSTNYEPMGEAVSVAARMEQAAEAGGAVISLETRRLAGAAIQVRPLGFQPVKGMPDPIELFALEGVSPRVQHSHRLHWDAASLFVGRETEAGLLAHAARRAEDGHGGAVAIIGEAGSGKSRLINEFLHRWRDPRPGIAVGHARSFAQRPFQVIISLLENWFDISAADTAIGLADKIRAGFMAVMPEEDQQRASAIMAVSALFDLMTPAPRWLRLDPGERRNRITESVQLLFRRVSQTAPLAVIAEDLHWADDDSLHVLGKLIETAADARILIVMTCRDDQTGLDSAGVQTLVLQPFGANEARALLRSHLLPGADTSALEDLLIAHTGGNPLFIEESLISLSETGDLSREGACYRPVRPITAITLPATVRALIAARVDRLGPVVKDILRAAAVVGVEVDRAILMPASGRDDAALDDALASLREARFLVAGDTMAATGPFHFRHALTREAVYRGIMRRRRMDIHARVITAIERLHHNRIREYSETLAEHAQRAEDWPRAVDYARMSANKAVERSSNRAAVTCLNEALVAAEHMPEEPALLLDVLLELRYPLFKLGLLEKVSEILARAAGLAYALDDPRRLSLMHAYQSHISYAQGASARALREAMESHKAAARIPDKGLMVRARFQEGLVLTYRGAYAEGITALSEVLENVTAGFGAGSYPDLAMATNARAYISRAQAERGAFEEARVHAVAAVGLAETIEDAFVQIFAALCTGFLHLSLREPEPAITWLERAREQSILAEASDYITPLPSGFLGMAYVLAGQPARAVTVLEDAIRQAGAIGFRAGQPYRKAALARAYAALGRLPDARTLAEEADQEASAQGEVFGQATALCVLAEIAISAAEPRDAQHYLDCACDLARQHGLAPIEAWCGEVRAEAATRGQWSGRVRP